MKHWRAACLAYLFCARVCEYASDGMPGGVKSLRRKDIAFISEQGQTTAPGRADALAWYFVAAKNDQAGQGKMRAQARARGHLICPVAIARDQMERPGAPGDAAFPGVTMRSMNKFLKEAAMAQGIDPASIS